MCNYVKQDWSESTSWQVIAAEVVGCYRDWFSLGSFSCAQGSPGPQMPGTVQCRAPRKCFQVRCRMCAIQSKGVFGEVDGGSHPPNKGSPTCFTEESFTSRRKLVTNPRSITQQISNIESTPKVLHCRFCLWAWVVKSWLALPKEELF